MAEFLLELRSEEIPARMQARAVADLASLISKALMDAGLAFHEVETFVTPRRLVLAIGDVSEHQQDVEERRKGPRIGAPDKAIEGFKRSLGDAPYQLEQQDDPKGAFYVAIIQRKGRATLDLLPALIGDVLGRVPWPKAMRWSGHEVRWVRPLHGILCLFGGKVVEVGFGPVTASNLTTGHRFMDPQLIEVENLAAYKTMLANAHVMLDPAARRRSIQEQAEECAAQAGLVVRDDPALLDEVTGLVEWPVVLSGAIDNRFMELPEEVLVTSMRQHQKYLALEQADGALAPAFLVVANLEAKDGGQAIRAGNERVLRARLWDARFFWDQDRKQPLEAFLPALSQMVFHTKLGSIGDKVERLEKLAGSLAKRMPGASGADAARAARLAKADLMSGMVGEFPELQGIMGRHYALHQGETIEVADAIGEHYAPQGPKDRCPKAPTSVAVALADKLDLLAGFFAIGEKPSGSKDPFALRRAALGMIRLILTSRLRLSLDDLFGEALQGYRSQGISGGREDAEIVQDLRGFIADRLKVHLKEEGVRHDLISAVFATGDDDLIRLLARVAALEGFLASEDGANLLAGYRRASNIVRIEAKKDGRHPDGEVNSALLRSDEEQGLYAGLRAAEARINRSLASETYAEAMAALAELRAPIDSFFEKVIVNTEDLDLRRNRLSLLSNIHRALARVADFSVIEDVVNDNNHRRVA